MDDEPPPPPPLNSGERYSPISPPPPPPHSQDYHQQEAAAATSSSSATPSPIPPVNSSRGATPAAMEHDHDLGESMLHSLTKSKDPIDDGAIGKDDADDEDNDDDHQMQGKHQQQRRPIIVDRPAPSLMNTLTAILDRSTGLLSALSFNMNRDAGSIDMTLLRAR